MYLKIKTDKLELKLETMHTPEERKLMLLALEYVLSTQPKLITIPKRELFL